MRPAVPPLLERVFPQSSPKAARKYHFGAASGPLSEQNRAGMGGVSGRQNGAVSVGQIRAALGRLPLWPQYSPMSHFPHCGPIAARDHRRQGHYGNGIGREWEAFRAGKLGQEWGGF
jgi:hypothetical protein